MSAFADPTTTNGGLVGELGFLDEFVSVNDGSRVVF